MGLGDFPLHYFEVHGLVPEWPAFLDDFQLHALAYNLANFLRTLALPEAVAHWSLTTLRE